MSTDAMQAWRRSVPQLVSRLKTDRHNALMLADPWSRAAHSMVQGWRIRLSRPPAKGSARRLARPTWAEFARLAVSTAATKANHARESDWHLWASRRVSGGSRYVPKRDRHWQGSQPHAERCRSKTCCACWNTSDTGAP